MSIIQDDCYHGSSREMPHSPPAADGMPSTLDLVQDFLLPRTSPPVPIRPPSPHYVFPDEIYQYDHTKPPTTDYGSRPFPSPTEKEALFNDPFLGSGARHHMPPYKPLRRNHFASKSSPLPFLYQSGLMRSRPVYRYAPVGQDSMQEHGFFRANVHRDTSAAYVRKVYPFAAEPAMHEQTYDTDEHPAKKKRKTTNSVLLNHSAETNKDHTTDLHGPARGFLSPPTFSTHPSEQVSEEESSFRIYKCLRTTLENKLKTLTVSTEEGTLAEYSKVSETLDAINMRMTELDPVAALVRSEESRVDLLSLCEPLGVPIEGDTIREALDTDEGELRHILGRILASTSEIRRACGLTREEAGRFIDAVHKILHDLPTGSNAESSDHTMFSHRVHRFLVKVVEHSGIIPAALKIEGIQLLEKDPISKGGFADIYLATHNGNKLVLKRITCQNLDSEGLIRPLDKKSMVFCREAMLWKRLDHPHVLPFLGVDYDTFSLKFICMASPYLSNGTILEHIKRCGRRSPDLISYICQIAVGLQYLHSQHIVHGDLRGANILIDDQFRVRLADFGLSVFVDSTVTTSHHEGTIRWMAPELFKPSDFAMTHSRRTFPSDVFAFGHVCVEVFTGREPFPELRNTMQVLLTVVDRGRPQRPLPGQGNEYLPLPDCLWDLVNSCWEHQPSDRPHMKDVTHTVENWQNAAR